MVVALKYSPRPPPLILVEIMEKVENRERERCNLTEAAPKMSASHFGLELSDRIESDSTRFRFSYSNRADLGLNIVIFTKIGRWFFTHLQTNAIIFKV